MAGPANSPRELRRDVAQQAGGAGPARILTCDPGIDLAAVAVWDAERLPAPGADIDAVLGALDNWQQYVTKAVFPTATRCAELAAWVRAVVEHLRVVRCYIERPVTYHVRTMKIQRGRVLESRDKLNRAFGALCAGAALGGAQVIEIEADSGPKDMRRPLLDAALARLGGRPTPNPDVADAVWLGLKLPGLEDSA